MAARDGNSSIVRLLLEAGADPSSANDRGASGLHYSVMFNSVENARLLLEAGAQLEAQTMDGATPLCIAVSPACSYDPEVIDLLLKHGANANARMKNGESCLHLAMSTYPVGIPRPRIQILLEKGANIEACGFRGFSVLHCAISFRHIYTLKILLARQKDQGTLKNALEARTDNGSTVLHLAVCIIRASPAVRLLLDYEAPVGARDLNGDMPLHLALTAIQRFLKNYPKEKARERAQKWDWGQKVVMLLDAGADPLAENNIGITPREIVQCDKDVASFLDESLPDCRPLRLLHCEPNYSHTESTDQNSAP